MGSCATWALPVTNGGITSKSRVITPVITYFVAHLVVCNKINSRNPSPFDLVFVSICLWKSHLKKFGEDSDCHFEVLCAYVSSMGEKKKHQKCTQMTSCGCDGSITPGFLLMPSTWKKKNNFHLKASLLYAEIYAESTFSLGSSRWGVSFVTDFYSRLLKCRCWLLVKGRLGIMCVCLFLKEYSKKDSMEILRIPLVYR